jgi:hypothetical protein
MNRNYLSPEIEVVSISVEMGFAQSIGAGLSDYNKNESDSMDD